MQSSKGSRVLDLQINQPIIKGRSKKLHQLEKQVPKTNVGDILAKAMPSTAKLDVCKTINTQGQDGQGKPEHKKNEHMDK